MVLINILNNNQYYLLYIKYRAFRKLILIAIS